jgi:hypothetical protein
LTRRQNTQEDIVRGEYLQTHIAIIGKVNAKQRAAENCTVQELNELVSTLQPTLHMPLAVRQMQSTTHRNQHAGSEVNFLRVFKSGFAALVHNF